MSTFARSINRGRALSRSSFPSHFSGRGAECFPQLHQRVHPDANRVEHSCAVTMIASGSYDHAANVPLLSAPLPAIQFSEIPALTPCWVQSPFLGAHIFEHAPPARG